MDAQAAALNLPLVHVEITSEPSYKESYVAGMRGLAETHGVKVIATGDMDLVGTMKRNWIEECGEECGIEAYLPLWKTDRESNIRAMHAEGIKPVFSCVKSPWFDGTWIGRELDVKALDEMMGMTTEPALDVGGERGEYHTMCVDSPLFSAPVDIGQAGAGAGVSVSVRELRGEKGQKEGEAWWVMDTQFSTPRVGPPNS